MEYNDYLVCLHDEDGNHAGFNEQMVSAICSSHALDIALSSGVWGSLHGTNVCTANVMFFGAIAGTIFKLGDVDD